MAHLREQGWDLGVWAVDGDGRVSPDKLARSLRDCTVLVSVMHAPHRRLAAAVPGLVLNGHAEERLPNTLHCSFPGVSGRDPLARTPTIAASVGSACHGEGGSVSGVLGAMGIPPGRAAGAVRLSIGEPTTDADIATAANALVATWRTLIALLKIGGR